MTLRTFPDLVQGKDKSRFQKFVIETDPAKCWEWQSVRNRAGYGKFWLHGRTELAHRVSYRMSKGFIPTGLQVRHTCDNRACVNPDHLLVGTGLENAQDALDRDRYRRGTDNFRAKLTEAHVRSILDASARGETQVSLARRFGVSRSAIQWILNGRNWRHVSGRSR